MDAAIIKNFCATVVSLKDERKEINEQINAEIKAFASCHNVTPRSVKEAVKVYEAQIKDAAESELVERERDELTAALMV